MVLDKYVTIKADKFSIGQDKDKLWFCKEFHADTTREIKDTISILNKIFNEANKDIVTSKSVDPIVVKKKMKDVGKE